MTLDDFFHTVERNISKLERLLKAVVLFLIFFKFLTKSEEKQMHCFFKKPAFK